jgi:protoheme IX farnesyltransferase
MTIPVEPAHQASLGPHAQRSLSALVADLIALTKPRITRMVVATMLGGAWVAERFARARGLPEASGRTVAIALVGTVLVVAGANTLNMYLERDTDGLMERTKDRPLPAGRMAPEVALWFGVTLSAVAVALLALFVNATTALLGAFALLSYVLVYTPLKRKTTLALLIGAVPGAIPPLLGWTSVTGNIEAPGAVLFGILFLWQVPHFLAIALFRGGDYHRAGLKVMPIERGERATRYHIIGYSIALIAVSLLAMPLGVAGPIYSAAALLLGAGFLGFGAWGLKAGTGTRWARGLFGISIVYLLLLFVALMIGA